MFDIRFEKPDVFGIRWTPHAHVQLFNDGPCLVKQGCTTSLLDKMPLDIDSWQRYAVQIVEGETILLLRSLR